MSTFSYGGTAPSALGTLPADGITLEQATILDYSREPVYDRHVYLYTRHLLRVRGIFNPLATSYQQASALAAPTQRTGLRAAQTDTAVRHLLAQPRRQLVLKVGTTTLLQSPYPGFTVDAGGGPFTRVNEVSLVTGTKTFVVDLTVETLVNECNLFSSSGGVILSHLYRMEHDVEADFMTTRTIHGHAVFNLARLLALGARADDFRAYLFHPVPAGFQRLAIQAVLSEDQAELTYTLVDREKTHAIGASAAAVGVTRIAGTHSSSISKPDIITAAGALLEVGAESWRLGALGAQWGAGRNFSAFGVNVNAGSLAGATLGAAAGVSLGMYRQRGMIPVNTQEVTVEVWGNNNSTRHNLRSVASSLVLWRLQNLPTTNGATYAAYLDDIAGHYVRATASVTAPPTDTLSQLLAGNLGASLRPFLPPTPGQFGNRGLPENGEYTPGILVAPNVALVGPPGRGPNGQAAGAGNARGTYVEALVSAALLAPCATPAAPTATPIAAVRTPA